MFGWGKERFDKHKFKAALKMAASRIRMQQNKKHNSVTNQRREIAQLMANSKYESARIKVEQVMRDEYYVEAIEMVALFCDLMNSRQMLFIECAQCPPDLKEAVSTIVWACPRTEGITELTNLRHQVCLKLGREFVETATNNTERAVNQKVYEKLSVMVPEPHRCLEYMKGIADEFDLDWESVESALATTDLVPPSQGAVPPPAFLPGPPPPPPTMPFGPPGVPPTAPGPTGYPPVNTELCPPPGWDQPPAQPQEDDAALEARLAALKRM
eukprot:TRINITY_DN3659_c0_g1_i1.p2 TRINITY_DN3659_c0_g1~~TRINITY_DN3659_c0_g1_i1.p2  ORF type:complete len:270 (+),score=89.52 TRINITY_DN3659_c0_g1_i1:287-1096(+)